MEGNTIYIILICVCLLFSAYFSATETAFSSINKIRLKNMADKGNKKAQLVMRLSDNYDSILSTILIGNNIVNIAGSSLGTVLFINLLGGAKGPGVATIVITVVVLIFGEISPKSIAKESPEKFAMFSAPFLRLLVIVLTPFNFLFGLLKKLLSLIFKSDDNTGITEEELITMVEEAEHEGGLDKAESSLIKSAIEFSEQEAMDILTPRIKVTAVEVTASIDEIAYIFFETGYSRLPVYDESIDNIVGIIYHKDFNNLVIKGKKKITEIMQKPIFITKNKKIGELLKELQKKKAHIAIVVDEFGGTVGIVTLEDILEELVGEIWDEHDKVVKEKYKISDNEYIVLGSANISKLEDIFEIDEDTDVMTVNGWVMEIMGELPQLNANFEYENATVTVVEMDGNRVGKIKITLREIESEDDD